MNHTTPHTHRKLHLTHYSILFYFILLDSIDLILMLGALSSTSSKTVEELL